MAKYSTGLQYFPFNIDFFSDNKIALIESEFGVKGSVIAIRLLCKIYNEGYFTKWGNDECLLFARNAGAGIVPELVKEVVNGLIKRSFFDKGVFDSFGVLTSRGIQQRYFEAAKRRQQIDVRRELLLCDISKFTNIHVKNDNVYIKHQNVYIKPEPPCEQTLNVDIKPDNVYISPDNAHISEQSKVDIITTTTTHAKNLIDDLKKSDIWLEQMAMKFKCPIDSITKRLDEFSLDCDCRGTSHSDLKDTKRHFNDWLRIQISNSKANNNGSELNKSSCAPRTARNKLPKAGGCGLIE